jgi:hypothetical protein
MLLARMPVALCFLAAVAAASAAEDSADTCMYQAGADLRCDHGGAGCSELGSVPAATEVACCAACRAKAGCNAAVLRQEGATKECFLKKLAAGTTLSEKRQGSVGCVPPPGPPAPPPAPAPFFPFRNHSLPIAERVQDLVGRLTLPEKILQMTRGGAAENTPAPAIARLGLLPHIWGSECATGLGSDDGSFAGTSFPQPLGQAATWNKDLIKQVATATAVELRAQHNDDLKHGVVKYHHGLNCWSPVINIMRHWCACMDTHTSSFCCHLFLMKRDHLPRQAQDKHTNKFKMMAFPQGVGSERRDIRRVPSPLRCIRQDVCAGLAR